MVLLEIYSESIALLPFEGDAPGTVDVQIVPPRCSSQGMKVEAWDVEIQEILGAIEGIEPSQRPSS